MSLIPRLNRTLYGRLFGIVPGHFNDNNHKMSHEYLETFNLGNNWFGGLMYRFRHKQYYGNSSNNAYSKYSKIWIQHNILALNFSEEILLVYTANKIVSTIQDIEQYKLKRVRFAAKPVVDVIEWKNLPRSLVCCINKKTDSNIDSCSCCGYRNKK